MASQPLVGSRTVRFAAVVAALATFAFGVDSGPEGPPRGGMVTVTWVGGTSTDWDLAANWSTNAVPTSADDVVVDNAGATNQPTLSSTAAVATLALSNGVALTIADGASLTVTGAATCDGSTLTLQGSGAFAAASLTYSGGMSTLAAPGTGDVTAPTTVQSGATLTTSGTPTISGSLTIDAPAGVVSIPSSLEIEGDVVVAGAIATTNGALIFSGAANAAFNVVPATGTVGCNVTVNKTSAAVTLVAATTTIGGELFVDGGALQIGAGQVLDVDGTANPSITVSRGSVVFGGAGSILRATNVGSEARFNGSCVIDGTGLVDAPLFVTNGSPSLQGGTISVSSTVTINGGTTLEVDPGATLNVGQSVDVMGTLRIEGDLAFGGGPSSPSMTIDGGTVVADGTITNANTATFDGTSTLSGGGTFVSAVSVVTGTLVIEDGASPTVNGGITLASGTTLNLDGDLTASGGVVSNGASIVGDSTLFGVLSVATAATTTTLGPNATIVVDDAILVDPNTTLLVHATSMATANGAGSSVRVSLGGAGATLTVEGTLATANGVESEGASTIGGAGSISATSAAGLTVSAGTTTITGGASFAISATGFPGVDVASGATLIVSGTLTPTGSPAGVVVTDATLVVSGSIPAGGGVQCDGATDLEATGSIASGLVIATGTTTLTGATNVSGGLTISAVPATELDLSNETLTVAGDAIFDGLLSGAGTARFSGGTPFATLTLNVATSSDVEIVSGAGPVRLGSGSLAFGGAFTLSGGSFEVPLGVALDVPADVDLVSGTLTIDGETAVGTAIDGAGGMLSGSGVVRDALDLSGSCDVAMTGRIEGAVTVSNGPNPLLPATISGSPLFSATGATTCLPGTSLALAANSELTISGTPTATGDVMVQGDLTLAQNGVLHVYSDVVLVGAGMIVGQGFLSFDATAAGACVAQVLDGTVSAGVALVGDAGFDGSLATLLGDFNVGSAAVVSIAAAGTLNVGGVFTLDGGTLTFGAGSTLVTGGGLVLTGTRTISGTGTIQGDVDVVSGTAVFPGGSSLTITGNLTLQSGGALSAQSATTVVQGQIIVEAGGSLDVAGGSTVDGDGPAPSLRVEGGAVTVAATGVLDLLNGVRVQNSATTSTFDVDGALTATTGVLEVRAPASFDGAGDYGPTLDVASADATIVGTSTATFSSASPVALGPGGSLFIDGTPTLSSGVDVAGPAFLGGAGSTSGFVTVASGRATIHGSASLTLTSGIGVDPNAELEVDGTLTLGPATPPVAIDGGVLDVGGTLVAPGGVTFANASFFRGIGTVDATVAINSGTTTVDSSADVTVTGAATAATGTTLVVTNGAKATFGALASPALELQGAALDASGTVEAPFGVQATGGVEFSGTNGTIDAPVSIVDGIFGVNSPGPGSKTTILAGSNLAFAGAFDVASGATCVFQASASVGGAMTISGSLLIASSAVVTATAAAPSVALLGGSIEVAANGALAASSEVRTSGATANVLGPGSIGGPLVVASDTTTVGAPLSVTGGLTVSAGAFLAPTFDVSVAGDVSVVGEILSGGTLRLLGATPPASFVASGANPIQTPIVVDAGSDSIAISGGGTTTLSGAVSVQSGTLTVPSTEILASSSGVSVTGGALAVDGELSGGVVAVSGGALLGAGVVQQAVDLSATGDVAFTGRIAGLLRVLPAATAVVSGTPLLRASATPPTTCATGTTSLEIQATAGLSLVGTIESTGDVLIDGALTFSGGALNLYSALTVNGTMGGSGTLGLVADAPCPPHALSGTISVAVNATGTAGTTFGAGPSTIDRGLTVASGHPFTVPSGAFVTVNGVATSNGGLFDVDGQLEATGGFSLASASTTFDGAGLIIGAFTLSGGTTTFVAGSDLALQDGVSIGSGATASFAATAGTDVQGQIVVNAGGVLNVATGGTLNAQFAGLPSILVLGGTVDVDSGGVAATTNGVAAQTTASTFDVEGSLQGTGALALDVAADFLGAGGAFGLPTTVNPPATATFQSGASPVFSAGFDAPNGATVVVATGANPSATGATTVAGSFTVQTGATFAANGPTPGLAATGATFVVDGTLSTLNGATTQGTTSFGGGGLVDGPVTILSGTTSADSTTTLTFGGALTAASGAAATFDGPIEIDGLLTVQGTATVATGETLTLNALAPAALVDTGVFDVDGTLAAAGGLSCQGASTLDGLGTIDAPTTIAAGTTTLVVGSNLTFPLGATLDVATGATLAANAAATAAQDVVTVFGTLDVGASSALTASGPASSLVVDGGTVELEGTLTATNGCDVSGTSTFRGVGGQLVGATTFSGGTATVLALADVSFDGPWTILGPASVLILGDATVTGAIASTGAISVGGTGTLTATAPAPAATLSGGSAVVDGVFDAAGGVTTQNVVSLGGLGLFDAALSVDSGTTTVVSGAPTFRFVDVGTAGVAAFVVQAGAGATIADSGAGLLRILPTTPQSTATLDGPTTADAVQNEGSLTTSALLTVLGLLDVRSGAQATFNGAVSALNVEFSGTGSATAAFDTTQLLGVRLGGTFQVDGVSTAQSVEVDGTFTIDVSGMTVSALYDVRAGGVGQVFAPSTFGVLTIAGSCAVASIPGIGLTVLGDATVDGGAASLSVASSTGIDVDGSTFVRNGGVFNGTGASHFFGGDLDCTPGGTLVHDATTIFTFDGPTVAAVDCSSLPETRCAKASGSSLTLQGGATLSSHLRVLSGALSLSGGVYAVSGSVFVSGGTFETAGGALLQANANVVFDAPAPAATATVDADVFGNWSANASFAPSAGLVRFQGGAQAIGSAGGYAGALFFFGLTIENGTAATATAPLQTRGPFDLLGTLTASGVALGSVPFVVEARDDFDVGPSGVYSPNGLPTNVAGSLTCANPSGLPQSASAPGTVFRFGASADFVATPIPAVPGPLNRATVVLTDAPLPSVEVAIRGATATIQLAEFANQGCPPGDAACTTARAVRVLGSFLQASDAGATTLLHSSSLATPAPSFSLDVLGPAVFTGGEFLCCTADDFLVSRTSTTWSGGTCSTLANIVAFGDWTTDANFAPKQGAVELRGDGLLDSTAPDGAARFAALKVTPISGVAATRTVFEAVRFGSAPGGVPAPHVTIAQNATLAVKASPGSPTSVLRSVDATYALLGTLDVGDGGAIEFGPTSTLNVPAGSTLKLRAASSEPRATLRAFAGAPGWSVTVGGVLDAERFAIEDPGNLGLVVQSSATLTSFIDGVFTRTSTPSGTSVLLDLRRPASTTPFVVSGMQFGAAGTPSVATNQTTGALNVRTQLSSSDLHFENWTGTLGGNLQDDDPFESSPLYAANGGKVRWGQPAATVISSFSALGGPERAVATWSAVVETAGASFDVERATSPGGPYVVAGSAPCTGAGSYWCVDEPLLSGTTYWYRLVENVPGAPPRVLGTAAATPFSASFASAPNVFSTGAAGGFATPQAAIDAAVLANLPSSVVRLVPGTYPAFSIGAVPVGGLRVVADGGPVVIDTTNGPITIAGISSSGGVVLQGLDVGGATSPHEALVVTSCAAPIFVLDCALAAGAGKAALAATATFGLTLDDVACVGAPGLSLSGGSAAAFNGTSNATTATNGAALREAGFQAGVATLDATSTRTTFAGVAPTLDVAPFAKIGAPLSITFTAEPNAPWLFVAATKPWFAVVTAAPIDLPVLVDLSTAWFAFEAFTDAAGQTTVAFLVPPDPALIGFSPVFQGAAYLPSVGRFRCSSPAPTTAAP